MTHERMNATMRSCPVSETHSDAEWTVTIWGPDAARIGKEADYKDTDFGAEFVGLGGKTKDPIPENQRWRKTFCSHEAAGKELVRLDAMGVQPDNNMKGELAKAKKLKGS